ncbi:hypothetical protein MLD63_05170 [Paracoccus sp. TK19116]|uniref:Uncharacterized protein n=1 Tax=Paracoccus albicereus TaxID=2922394 RepID=A0ABT1MNY4_9RHOB|nr:hypothetical protein [Paracoccus albicereus]MCQ0969819.1 hypothetical protein [Paracoccus albicereus]
MRRIGTRTANAALYGNRLISHLSDLAGGRRKVSQHLTYSEMMKDTGATGIPIGVGRDLEYLLEALETAGLPLGLTLFVTPKKGVLGELLDLEGFAKRAIRKETLLRFRKETLDYDWDNIVFEQENALG